MNAAATSTPARSPRMAAALRRIGLPLARGAGFARLRGLLVRRAAGLLPRGGRLARGLRLRGDVPQRRLEVVEDEADGGVAPRRGGDARLAVAHDEDAALACRDFQLRERALTRLELVG